MIILSNALFSDSGQNLTLKIRNYSDSFEYNNAARISRVSTLDGSTSVNHYGATELDRDLSVKCRVSEEDAETLKYFQLTPILLRISYFAGSYMGYIYSLNILRDGSTTIIIYFSEELS